MELIKCIVGRLGCILMKIDCMLEWGNIIANKSAKLRVQSSFFNPMAVDPFFLGHRGSRIGAVLVHNGQMS